MDDRELLRDYVQRQSEKAFAELVGRYLDLVYSTALRMVREKALAEDVAQAVFVQLARKATTIREGNALPGWLYRVTHCQAANVLRAERTRRQHESEAINMTQNENESSAPWESIAPHLEEAMNTLSDEDQNAVLQRFFQGRSWREVGTALALSEDAAQKRVSRALDKLRTHLAHRGIAASAAGIGLAIAANAVQAAPSGLMSAVTTASLAGTVGAGISTFASTTLESFLMKKTIIVTAALILTASVTIPVTISLTKKARLNAPATEKGLRKGLVLHMTFDRDETGVGKVTDSSSKGNHGKPSGVQWTPDGKKGGAYEFTADGNEIVIANNDSVNPKQLTLAAWIKTSFMDDKWRRIFDKSYSKGYALSIAADWQGNKWRGLGCMEIGPGTHFILTKSKVADGQWHQVVTTFDGTEELFYVDGQPQGKALHWGKPGQVGTTDFNLVIGCNRSNLTEDDLGSSFRGLIDEPMMWNRALTQKEVAFLFESQNGPATSETAAN